MPARLAQRLHDQFHKLPGIPAHENRRRGHHPARTHPRNPNARPPRVLKSWQAWIGRLVGQSGD